MKHTSAQIRAKKEQKQILINEHIFHAAIKTAILSYHKQTKLMKQKKKIFIITGKPYSNKKIANR